MLAITRKKNQSVFIGDNIEVKITKIEDGSVRLAIDAPKNITILRSEIVERIKEENKKAAGNQSDLLNILK